ncbi:uncharacterized protein EDB93DRAFT_1254602 [Suillus bovinus]|uniref:uncharacterized protein n=1 Tax=Suillus bovinus TaxID=48563 RepID=UPI001B880C83|nr:uncharacterized protein EDB93DRAFT_1254602 [Suillus bovinus]KAG2134170.1 hypothetical protein EDB93DRAFT_1254602 [Suillus bovinus]
MPNSNNCKYMNSTRNLTDKARTLQDKRIKADRNFFLIWDQWVPPKLGPTQTIPQDNLQIRFNYSTQSKCPLPSYSRNIKGTKFTPSTMPVREEYTDALAEKQKAKKAIFEMCWNTEAQPVPSVQTPTGSSSAEHQYSSQTFEMCWSVEPDLGPTVNAPAKASMVNAPSAKHQYSGQTFEMCWSVEPDLGPTVNALANASMVDSPAKASTVDSPAEVSSAELQYGSQTFEMCWDVQEDPARTVDVPV